MKKGDVLATFYGGKDRPMEELARRFRAMTSFSNEPISATPLIIDEVYHGH